MNLFDLAGRTALVTGAGSGLGREFALGLAACGAEIIAADRNPDWLEETVGLVGQSGGRAHPVLVDVADRTEVAAMATAAAKPTGRIDILVNNAGVAPLPKRTHELDPDEWDRVVNINLTGVFLCTRAVLPVMLAQGSGSIISVASILALGGFYPGFARTGVAYGATKAGVIGLTRQVAVEYAADGIRANAIAPGWHGGTRLGAAATASDPGNKAAFEAAILAGTPMRRRGKPEELRGLVIYLASDAASYVTGQVFTQDGGWTAQ